MSLRTVISRATLPLAALLLPVAALAVDPLHPLGKDVTIETLIGNIIGAALGLMGTLALAVFMWSGFTWMTAGGNADKIKVAQKNFVYATAGLIVCFGSYAFLQFILSEAILGAVKAD